MRVLLVEGGDGGDGDAPQLRDGRALGRSLPGGERRDGDLPCRAEDRGPRSRGSAPFGSSPARCAAAMLRAERATTTVDALRSVRAISGSRDRLA
jgi:hypothetical protein